MNDETAPTPPADDQATNPPEDSTESASPTPSVDEPSHSPRSPPAEDVPAVAEPHPVDSLLARIESEVDSMLHSPLALANWVKSMVAEARKLL